MPGYVEKVDQRVVRASGPEFQLYEPLHEKTNILCMQKQRRRSAPLFSLHG